MPKNLKGGSHHKKMASKDTKSSTMFRMRYGNSKEPSEMYAIVTNVYGGGMLEVKCNDGVKRLCVIRRKFKGRNKRDNQISINSILIVGLRDWEVVQKNKKEKVDLLYVYDANQTETLKNNKDEKITLFNEEEDQSIQFDDTDETIFEKITVKKSKVKEKNRKENEKIKGNLNINWDDI